MTKKELEVAYAAHAATIDRLNAITLDQKKVMEDLRAALQDATKFQAQWDDINRRLIEKDTALRNALQEVKKLQEERDTHKAKSASWEKAHDNVFQMLETEKAKGREYDARVRATCEAERRGAMEELVLKALRR